MMKADGSVLIHPVVDRYKPLNWMSPPCSLVVEAGDTSNIDDDEGDPTETWTVSAAKDDATLIIRIYDIVSDHSVALGVDPGLVKDGVEAHLQSLLADQVELVGEGTRLVRREYPTAIGPVDLMVKDAEGSHIAIEVKRRGEIAGVEQLTRYLELLNRDPLLAPVSGIFAAQEIKPQAKVLAEDRGIRCLTLDYDVMRGLDRPEDRLF